MLPYHSDVYGNLCTVHNSVTLYLKYSIITPYNCHNHVIATAISCHSLPVITPLLASSGISGHKIMTSSHTTKPQTLAYTGNACLCSSPNYWKERKHQSNTDPGTLREKTKKKVCCSQLFVEGTNKVATLLLSSQRPLNNGFASHHAVQCSVSWNWQPGPSYNSLYPLRRFSGQSEAHLLQLRSSLLPCIIHQDECWSQNKPHQQHIFCHSRETKGFKCSGTTTLTWKLWKTKSTQLKDADLCKHFFKL